MRTMLATLIYMTLLLSGCRIHSEMEDEQGVESVNLLVTRESTLIVEPTRSIVALNVTTPPARYQHSMTYDTERHVVVMFGGITEMHNLKEPQDSTTWEYDGISWKQHNTAVFPPARAYHHMAYDSARGIIVLFGGSGFNGWFDNTIWEYDGEVWREIETNAHPIIHELSSMAYDVSMQAIVFYSYRYGENDTWMYSDNSWKPLSIENPLIETGERIFQSFLVYDDNREKLIQLSLLPSGRSLTLSLPKKG